MTYKTKYVLGWRTADLPNVTKKGQVASNKSFEILYRRLNVGTEFWLKEDATKITWW